MLNVSALIRLASCARRIDDPGRARSSRRALVLAAVVGAMMLASPAASSVSFASAHQPAVKQPTVPSPAAAARQPTRPRAAQDEFVPVSDLPDSEKLPAAPFLIAAYTFVWLMLLGYVWSLWRRLTLVEQELKRAVAEETRHA